MLDVGGVKEEQSCGSTAFMAVAAAINVLDSYPMSGRREDGKKRREYGYWGR